MCTAPAALARQFLYRRLKLVVGITQKDQPQHRAGVFRGLQPGIGPPLIRRSPRAGFDVIAVMIHCFSMGLFLCHLNGEMHLQCYVVVDYCLDFSKG